MSASNHWAIVLAAGEGTRLRELTTREGIATPKQFCSLRGGRSLLGDALARATRVVPRKRVVVVVAEEHRSYWESDLGGIPAENVIVQPRNRGTAPGLLLPLLSVLERDPGARIVVLPSDHFVEHEGVLEGSLRLALESLDEHPDALTLLGITPDSPETEYGWIVPSDSPRLLRPIESFVEKPGSDVASELFARGGVWNSFLFAAHGASLVQRFERRLPGMVSAFRSAFDADGSERVERLDALYGRLETRDFSRDVIQGAERGLLLEIVPPCGWTDLGTPQRVEACLETLWELPEPHGFLGGAALDLSRCVLSRRNASEQEPAYLSA
jgi:mannose-1-phosphate guanylyltransferase